MSSSNLLLVALTVLPDTNTQAILSVVSLWCFMVRPVPQTSIMLTTTARFQACIKASAATMQERRWKAVSAPWGHRVEGPSRLDQRGVTPSRSKSLKRSFCQRNTIHSSCTFPPLTLPPREPRTKFAVKYCRSPSHTAMPVTVHVGPRLSACHFRYFS